MYSSLYLFVDNWRFIEARVWRESETDREQIGQEKRADEGEKRENISQR